MELMLHQAQAIPLDTPDSAATPDLMNPMDLTEAASILDDLMPAGVDGRSHAIYAAVVERLVSTTGVTRLATPFPH
jgi:hypothetical protein